jgi:hypothetical protein
LLYLKGHVFMSETASGTAQKSQESGIQSVPGTQGTTQAHTAGPLESKPGMAGLLLWRQGCRCGYRPMWERTPGQAIESNARHYNWATR